jgi:heptosyltransferase I
MNEVESGSFLIVRLGALGDIVHTLPAAAALRSSFPKARLGWVVEEKWLSLVQMVSGIDEVIPLRKTAAGYLSCIRRLRRAGYSCAVDFQGLYKSALLMRFSGATRRIGRDRSSARESGAAWFYTQTIHPAGRHIAEMNLSLAEGAAASRPDDMRFPLRVPEEAIKNVREALSREGVGEFVVVSPGGGWKSKCWPAERYGQLCAELWRRHGLCAVVNAGPGEGQLAQEVIRAAAPAKVLVLSLPLTELAALLVQAKVVIAADTGPLHLAAALGARNVALFGPTDPARNGPLPRGSVLRTPISTAKGDTRGAYRRGAEYSHEMLTITVAQVLETTEHELAGTSSQPAPAEQK